MGQWRCAGVCPRLLERRGEQGRFAALPAGVDVRAQLRLAAQGPASAANSLRNIVLSRTRPEHHASLFSRSRTILRRARNSSSRMLAVARPVIDAISACE